MDRMIFDARDESDTAALGAALVEVLPDGTTVALCGTLGAGKTRLVQAMAEAAGIDRRQVVSPTFVLAQEYRGSRRFYHLDAFRLNNVEEFLDLGPEEFFESDAITLVEWADRVDACLPEARIEIHIEVTGTQSRRFIILAISGGYDLAINRLQARLTASK
jgi:tRNA threonylcarbamoyladenosine biosynthesis protein TsaE